MGEAMRAVPPGWRQGVVSFLTPDARLSLIAAFPQQTVHGLWTRKQACVECLALGLRLVELPTGSGTPAVTARWSKKQGSTT